MMDEFMAQPMAPTKPATTLAISLPLTNRSKFFRVTCTVDGVPFRYQFVAESRQSAILAAKELMPSSVALSILEEGEW